MSRVPCGTIEVESELAGPGIRARLVHYHFTGAPDSGLLVEGKFRIELCLTTRHRSARGCFSDVWGINRFERIGTLFVVPPNMKMLARSDECSSMTSILCELDSKPLLELFVDVPTVTDAHLLASLDVHAPRVQQLLLRLADEVKHPGFASSLLTEMIAGQLQVELFRHGATISERPPHGGLAHWQLRMIDEYVREVHETPTLTTIAKMCRISVRQLTRGFRESRGVTLAAYIAMRQMEHAKSMLARNQSVTTIARQLGFASASNFCYAFRRTTGITAGEFKRKWLRR